MMNKIFAALLALTIVGAGILFWLMRSLPQNGAEVAHDPTKPTTEVHTTDSGVKIVEKGEGAHSETPVAGEHPEHAVAHGSEHGADHGSEEAVKKSEVELVALDKEKSKTKAPRLNITTSPVPAMVFVDGELIGQIPMSVELTDKPQTIKLEAAGYEEVMRESPTKKESKDVENLNWRITLKEAKAEKAPKVVKVESEKKIKAPEKVVAAAVEKHSEKTPHAPHATSPVSTAAPVSTPASADAEMYFQGRGGPVWIQVKALSPEEVGDVKMYITNLKSRTKEPVVACRVDIKGKGQFTRILVGPFENKVAGNAALKNLKASVESTAFVTGVQECL